MQVSRRMFLHQSLLAPVVLSLAGRSFAGAADAKRLRFGIITDVHQDVMPDGVERLTAFVEAMKKAEVDFVIQLGDFCVPHERNQAFLAAWNAYKGTKYHVLGNHDTDGGFKTEQTLAFWGMKEPYYTFDQGPVRGIVLNGNERGGKAKGYPRFIGETQLAWLAKQLAQSDRPVMLFVHQPFDDTDCIENSAAVRAVIDEAEKNTPGRVLCIFSGHHHLNYQRELSGVHYVQINSASYLWMGGGKVARETFAPEVHQAHRYLKNVAAYRDPLWAVATLDPAAGTLTIEGRESQWIGPDPWQRGGEEKDFTRDRVAPSISNRAMKVGKQ